MFELNKTPEITNIAVKIVSVTISAFNLIPKIRDMYNSEIIHLNISKNKIETTVKTKFFNVYAKIPVNNKLKINVKIFTCISLFSFLIVLK